MKAYVKKLNPMVFVKDENDPEFRAHLLRRLKEAEDPKNRNKHMSIDQVKERLMKNHIKRVAVQRDEEI